MLADKDGGRDDGNIQQSTDVEISFRTKVRLFAC